MTEQDRSAKLKAQVENALKLIAAKSDAILAEWRKSYGHVTFNAADWKAPSQPDPSTKVTASVQKVTTPSCSPNLCSF